LTLDAFCRGALARAFSIACSALIAFPPTPTSAGTRLDPKRSANPDSGSDSAVESQALKLGFNRQEAGAFGVTVRPIRAMRLAALHKDIDIVLSCHGSAVYQGQKITNVTAGCASISLISTAPVKVEIPYDVSALPEGISESEVRIFKVPAVATSGPMVPISSYVDVENKKTIATLSEQAGHFVNGVLKAGERPDRAPVAFSNDMLTKLHKADAHGGVPKMKPPEVNANGDLRLNYQLDLPGARDWLKPQVLIGYSAQSGGGNIAEGWSLSVPSIAVETRWGIPIYDPKLETETYLFNGEQLVPEAGDYFVGKQAQEAPSPDDQAPNNDANATDERFAAFNLVPLPHRATKLRPRKTGKAHFVLQRDDGLWRFVRHGDTPESYWWEGWQENAGPDLMRVMYFGRSPGRVPNDIAGLDAGELENATGYDKPHPGQISVSTLTLGPSSGNANPVAISRWALAREKDSVGNFIDYDWIATCQGKGGGLCPAGGSLLEDRDLYLKRILYTGHQDIEETLLRCRERPSSSGCLHKQALFEVNFTWTGDGRQPTLFHRVDARSGGLTVSRRLLERIDVRLRRRAVDAKGQAHPIHTAAWQCSLPFLAYEFSTIDDPLYRGGQGKRWLAFASKIAPKQFKDLPAIQPIEAEAILMPTGIASGAACGAPVSLRKALEGKHDELVVSHKTRFDYKNPTEVAAGTFQAFGAGPQDLKRELGDKRPDLGGRIDVLRAIVRPLIGGGDTDGPYAPSMLGSVETGEVSGGIYLGVGFGPSKAISVGYKRTASQRTSHDEAVMILDVTGDGIADLVTKQDGKWSAFPGRVDANSNVSFAEPIDLNLPPNFRFQHEPVMEAGNSGFEAHAYGGFFGISWGRSTTVQTVQMADMDGDGRVDVVTPHGVFYNTEPNAAAPQSFGFMVNSPYIRAGLPAFTPSDVPPQRNELARDATLPSSKEHPRYDAVRVWRAPMTGIVRITGTAQQVARDDEIARAWNAATPPSELPPAHRDGVIVAVERSRGTATLSCAAGYLSPVVVDRLPPAEPDAAGTWRLIGSRIARVRSTGATPPSANVHYRLSLAPLATPRKLNPAKPGNSAWVSRIAIEATGFANTDRLRRAFVDAMAAWKPADGGIGTMAFEASSWTIRYEGDGASIPPLVVTLPVTAREIGVLDPLPGSPSVALSIQQATVGAVKDDRGVPGVSSAGVTTRIVPSKFEADGEKCAAGTNLAAVRSILSDADIPAKLLVRVEKNDAIYFRVHSIDNGDDDAVDWDPLITYLDATEETLPTAYNGPPGSVRFFGPGVSQSPNSVIAGAARDQTTLCRPEEGHRTCDRLGRSLLRYRASLPADGPVDLPGEKIAKDPGDLPVLALPFSGMVMPRTGAVSLRGTLSKPETAGAAYLEYVVVPLEVLEGKLTNLEGSHAANLEDAARGLRACDGDAIRIGRRATVEYEKASFTREMRGFRVRLEQLSHGSGAWSPVSAMDKTAGTYRIRQRVLGEGGDVCKTREGRRANLACGADTNEFDVRNGDRVCLFVRTEAPTDADAPRSRLDYWPVDAARFSVPSQDPFTIAYSHALVFVPEGAPPVPDDNNPEPGKPDPLWNECVGLLGNPDPRKTTYTGPDGVEHSIAPEPGRYVCRSMLDRFYVPPLVHNGGVLTTSVGLVESNSPSPLIPPQRTVVRAETLRLPSFKPLLSASPGIPSPRLSCGWDPQPDETVKRIERRFTLDVRTLFANERYVNDRGESIAYGDAIADVRTRAFAHRGGVKRALPIHRFSVFDRRAIPVNSSPRRRPRALFPGDLAGNILPAPPPQPSTNPELVYDVRLPDESVAQTLRLVRGVQGTISLTTFVEPLRIENGQVVGQTSYELPSGFIGFAVCAAEDEEISLETAIDDRGGLAENLAPLDRLLGTRACVGLPPPPLGLPNPELGNSNPLVRLPVHVCPLVRGHIRLAVALPSNSFSLEDVPLTIGFAPHQVTAPAMADTEERGPRRLIGTAEPITSRGAVAVAIRHATDADIKDPIDTEANKSPPYPVDDLNALQRLTAYDALLNALRTAKYDEKSVDPRVAQQGGGKCSKDAQPPADNADQGKFQEELHTDCSRRETNAANSHTTQFPAYPLHVGYRRSQPDGVNREAVQRDRSGGTGPAGERTPDVAKSCAWLARSLLEKSEIPAVRANLPPLVNSPSGTQKEMTATWASPDPAIVGAAGTDGADPNLCGTGPDPSIWTFSTLLSASRLGMKDLHFGAKAELFRPTVDTQPRPPLEPGRGVGLAAPARASTTRVSAVSVGFGYGKSWSSSLTNSRMEVADLNGDGFPDVITGNQIVYTDPLGGNRGNPSSPWCIGTSPAPCNDGTKLDSTFPEPNVRTSSINSVSESVGFPGLAKTYKRAASLARGAFSSSSHGVSMGEAGSRTQQSFFPFGMSVERGEGKGERVTDLVDVNGDGLPDIVLSKGASARLNLGYKFSEAIALPRGNLFGDQTKSAGLGLSIGYANGLNNNDFEGGMAANAASGDQNKTFVDINGDGYPDIVTIDNDGVINANFNLGWGYSSAVQIGSISRDVTQTFGRTETDNATYGGAYTYSICFLYVCFHINPNIAISGALMRQSIVFRDVDGDGLPDFVIGGSLLKSITQGKTLRFENTSAIVVRNGLGQHGLLERVWLPTNPSPAKEAANYEFSYARTPHTTLDPHHRWVMSAVTVRDGIAIDDASDLLEGDKQKGRMTCFTYAGGFFDRFERRFLGYSRVDAIEGCARQPRTPIEIAGEGGAAKLAGVRRTERHYANRTLYENGLLLEERVFDITAGPETADGLRRTTRQTYALIDTALSGHARVICHALRRDRPAEIDQKILALGYVRDILGAGAGSPEHPNPEPASCRNSFEDARAAVLHAAPTFDVQPRRLTPFLVQTVRETREAGSTADRVMRTSLQFESDHLARPVKMCDLGEISPRGAGYETRGAICSFMDYDVSVRPHFTHGATGGGTVLIEQRNRVKEIRVMDFPAPANTGLIQAYDAMPDGPSFQGRMLRRRTASYDSQSGLMSTLCQFTRLGPDTLNPCAQFMHFPFSADRLVAAAQAGVAMRALRYDTFGNLENYIGPMGSGGSFIVKSLRYDQYLSLVETSERTDYCRAPRVDDAPNSAVAVCLGKHVAALGGLVSRATAIDYRHAVPTTNVDINRNATHIPLDAIGRPLGVYVSWELPGPQCEAANGCHPLARLDGPAVTFRQIAAYAYDSFGSSEGASSTIVTRYSDPKIYRIATQPADPFLTLRTKTLVDQFGQAVQSFSEADVCMRSDPESLKPGCESRLRIVATGIGIKDILDRPSSEAYPFGLDAPNIATLGIRPDPVVNAPRSRVTFDGLDRPLVVSMPDGNGYDFGYSVDASLNAASGRRRHRTEMRDAMCVPSAIERDGRGAIRTVIESYTERTVEGAPTAAIGSAGGLDGKPDPADEAEIKAAGLVATISQSGRQQVYTCTPKRGAEFQLATRHAVTAYDRDALGQLVAVRLPKRRAEVKAEPSNDSILVAYDALGRRALIDDPDRGFERIHYDVLGNAICRYSGPRRRALKSSDFGTLRWDDVLGGQCTDRGDEPHRVAESTFLAGLPLKVTHRTLVGQLKDVRTVELSYGAPDEANRKLNRVGRAFATKDMTGSETRDYDPLGRTVKTVRAFSKLADFGPEAGRPKLEITEAYDIWGLLKSKRFQISVPPKGKGTRTIVDETIVHRYTIGGQLAAVEASTASPTPTPTSPTAIVSGLEFDARGNLLETTYATGVAAWQGHDPTSNRLTAARARMGIPGAYIPQILFQQLRYSYDAAGNVLAYDNQPVRSEGCDTEPRGTTCGTPVPDFAAKAHGLLITGSSTRFDYDQLNRVRSASKSIESVFRGRLDNEGQPQLLDDSEIGKSKPMTLTISEKFAFQATHEMALMKRVTATRVVNEKPQTATVISKYISDDKPRHAPSRLETVYPEKKLSEKTGLGFDDFGRMTASICTLSSKKGCYPDRYFKWNADDSLHSQVAEIKSERLPEAKKAGPQNKGLVYYDHIISEYDHAGRRVYKQLKELRRKAINGVSKPAGESFVSDTLYADAQLTIMRQEGQAPQAVVHYFAGPQRVASKWVGEDQLFTYHAQLMTRNVTDIVVGKPGQPQTARLHGQQEYAAFGEIVHERETLLANSKDGQTSRMRTGLPHYRFNAKEQDESGLQDFGARFYDNKLALWLRPDPILHEYLDGRANGGVYASKNLASYGFGWSNPVAHVDMTGELTEVASNWIGTYDQSGADRGIYKGGHRIGLTGFIDSHLRPTGKVHFNVDITQLFYRTADEMNLHTRLYSRLGTAFESRSGGDYDVKSAWLAKNSPTGRGMFHSPYDSAIIRGKYYSLRDIGNMLQGYWAARQGMSLDDYMSIAGQYQEAGWSGVMSSGAFFVSGGALGKKKGTAPTYGEDQWTYERVKAGYQLYQIDHKRGERKSPVDLRPED